jgi:outer membrane protein
MRRLFGVAFLWLLCASAAYAQSQDVWSLERAVQYALDNNLSIKQNELNQRLAGLTLKQSKFSQLPNVNLSTAYGRSYGRSVDPTTNQFVDGASYDFSSLGGNVDVLLFGWFQRRNNIASNKFSLEAAGADLGQLRNDISLNVATGYLRALLAQEQIHVNEKQVDLSMAQLGQTRKFADAGRVPELSVAQLESQLASDSANLITAISTYNSAILDLKALLNLDFETQFILEAPNVQVSDQAMLAGTTPAIIYTEALRYFGSIKAPMLREQALQKNLAAAKGGLWPSLSANAQLGTNFASTYTEVSGVNVTGTQPTGAFVQVTDSLAFPIYQPTYSYSTRRIPIGNQFDNNFRQTISLAVSIPVFNGWQSQYSVRQAKINLLNAELNTDQARLKLKQDVYKAYNEAVNAVQKYYAADRAASAAQRAYQFSQKRYDLGLTNTVDYLITQNNQFVAEANLLSAKYDLIFKIKVIDYYLGKELKL